MVKNLSILSEINKYRDRPVNKVQRAKEELLRKAIPGVTAVGITRLGEKIGLKVNVRSAVFRADVPKNVLGVPVLRIDVVAEVVLGG